MDGKAVLRDKKEVKADSLQNPNDPDATYRAKNDQKVQGYVTNITETIEEGKPNIFTSVQVQTAVFQNPNDPDATYRAKNDQKVQGYVTNITETIEEGKPNIFTSVQVQTAVFADSHFVQEAVENSERVTDSTIEDLYADGAYPSPDNREFAKNHNAMQLKTGKMQGGCRWQLIPHD